MEYLIVHHCEWLQLKDETMKKKEIFEQLQQAVRVNIKKIAAIKEKKSGHMTKTVSFTRNVSSLLACRYLNSRFLSYARNISVEIIYLLIIS